MFSPDLSSSSTSSSSVECVPKHEQEQEVTSDFPQGLQLAGAGEDTMDREQNTDALKSSSLSITATPFIPKGRPPGPSTDATIPSVATPRMTLDHPPHMRKTSFPHTPAELSAAVIGRVPSQGIEQPGHPAFALPPKAPHVSVLYNSVPRLPHPPVVSTVVVIPQMVKPVAVAAGRKGREAQLYGLPTQDRVLLHSAPLHRQLSGGNGGGMGGEKGGVPAKEAMPIYRFPSHPAMGGEVVPVTALGSAPGLDMTGRHHIHPSHKPTKPFHFPGHGALHGPKPGIPPSNENIMAGAGRSTVIVGAAQSQRDANVKNVQTSNNNLKRALLPTPSHTPPRLSLHGPVSQPSWSTPLHAPVVPATLSHAHVRGGHSGGSQMVYPPEQAVPGVATAGYGGAGLLGTMTAAYTQN